MVVARRITRPKIPAIAAESCIKSIKMHQSHSIPTIGKYRSTAWRWRNRPAYRNHPARCINAGALGSRQTNRIQTRHNYPMHWSHRQTDLQSKHVLPLATPGMVATAILVFIFSWNNFAFALVLGGFDVSTAPVSVFKYADPEAGGSGQMMAAATMVTIPVFIIVLAIQKQLTAGRQATSLMHGSSRKRFRPGTRLGSARHRDGPSASGTRGCRGAGLGT